MLRAPTVHAFDETDVTRSVLKESFFDFVKHFWREIIPEPPVWNWHIPTICDEVQTVYQRVFKRLPKEYDLVINIPPGTTKSTIVSIMAMPWAWTNQPELRSIVSTHAFDLGMDLSRKARLIVESEEYKRLFPEVSLADDQNTKGHFATTRRGERYVATVGGKNPMGRHAHILTVDDPIDPQQVLSEAALRVANQFMEHTLPSRSIDKRITPIILLMQRLHQNDPTANRLRKGDENPVRHICLPSEIITPQPKEPEAEEESDGGKQKLDLTKHEVHDGSVKPKELERHYVNNLLDPVRLPRVVLNAIQRGSGYVYSGQYLQRPIPLGGGMFRIDKLNVDHAPPPERFKRIYRYWDFAATPDGGCRTAGVKMGETREGHFWILHVMKGQWETYTRDNVVLNTARADGRAIKIYREKEPGSSGVDSAKATIRLLAGFRVEVVGVTGDKMIRAEPFASQVNGGNVWVPHEAEWLADYIEEMQYFPNSTYKDQIDASSGCFNELHRSKVKLGAI